MNARESLQELQSRMSESIIGQDHVVQQMLLTLLCGGNALLEGLPGLAKTRAIKTLSKNLESDFSRIQFTPDLLPSDITGAEIYLGEDAEERFVFQSGPIFANLVLADEINRAPAKVQAALLEAMEEQQVTVAGTTHKMPDLFMVLATQNPVEQEGTYPLPEAQMDRFLMHITMTHPDDKSELAIMRLVRGEAVAESSGDPHSGEAKPIIPQSAIFQARKEIDGIQISESMEKYIVAIIAATRRPSEYGKELGNWIQVGVSPRGTIAIDKVARAHAWHHGSDHVTPDNIQAIAHDCLRHRLMLTYEANADGVSADQVIDELLRKVAVA